MCTKSLAGGLRPYRWCRRRRRRHSAAMAAASTAAPCTAARCTARCTEPRMARERTAAQCTVARCTAPHMGLARTMAEKAPVPTTKRGATPKRLATTKRGATTRQPTNTVSAKKQWTVTRPPASKDGDSSQLLRRHRSRPGRQRTTGTRACFTSRLRLTRTRQLAAFTFTMLSNVSA